MPKILYLSIVVLALVACQKPSDTATRTDSAPSVQAASATDDSAAPSTDGKTTNDLTAEGEAYKAWVQQEIDELAKQTQKFVDALKANHVDEAKRLYPLVRMHYERTEPIAESFGDLDPRIDNREADLQAGETWTGFHAIEKILWQQNTTKGTEKFADQLLSDIKELAAKVPTAQVDGPMMVEGAVDLLNEISTSKITGEEEIFSKTDLYDFVANIEGAKKIFEILTPKISAKDPALVDTLNQRFATVEALLAKHKTEQGYVGYDKLTDADKKALAESVNQLGEPLAQMGVVLK